MPNFLDTFHGNPRKSSPYAIYNTRFEDATVLAVDPKAMTARVALEKRGSTGESYPILNAFQSSGCGNLQLPTEGEKVLVMYSNYFSPCILCSPGRRVQNSVYSDITKNEQLFGVKSGQFIKQGYCGDNIFVSANMSQFSQNSASLTTELSDEYFVMHDSGWYTVSGTIDIDGSRVPYQCTWTDLEPHNIREIQPEDVAFVNESGQIIIKDTGAFMRSIDDMLMKLDAFNTASIDVMNETIQSKVVNTAYFDSLQKKVDSTLDILGGIKPSSHRFAIQSGRCFRQPLYTLADVHYAQKTNMMVNSQDCPAIFSMSILYPNRRKDIKTIYDIK